MRSNIAAIISVRFRIRYYISLIVNIIIHSTLFSVDIAYAIAQYETQ